jgi:hypothetical protein
VVDVVGAGLGRVAEGCYGGIWGCLLVMDPDERLDNGDKGF